MSNKFFSDITTKMLDVTDDYIEVEGYATVAVPDRDNDIVDLKGLDLANFLKNPIILYQHDRTQPIGKAINIGVNGDKLYIKARIFKSMDERAYYGIKNEVLKSFSIGFRAYDGRYDESNDTYIFTKAELFEISVVSIPANPEAIFQVVKGIDGECKGLCALKNDKNKELNIDKKTTIKEKDIKVENVEKQIETLTQLVKELREDLHKKQEISVVDYFKELDAEVALQELDEISKIVNEKVKQVIEGV